MKLLLFVFIFSLVSAKPKKIASISYQNITQCFPDIQNEKLEFDVLLEELKKTVDQKYPTTRSLLRYRKVLFTDPKLGNEKHRLTISLQKWVKGVPEYTVYLEKIDKDNIAEIVPASKEKFKNIIKEAPQKYLLGATLIEDESLWLDTKPNKLEMAFKTSNDNVIELDLSSSQAKTQLKCETKKTQGVLCLCLKR